MHYHSVQAKEILMSFIRYNVTALTIFILASLFSGCANTVYLKTEMDPTHDFKKEAKMFVFPPKNPTIEDKKFMLELKSKLKNNGYNIADELPVDYAVFFVVDEKSYDNTGSYTTYVPTTSYTTGYVGRNYVTGTTTSTQAVTNTYSYTTRYKKIYVDILSTNKNVQGDLETIWSGFMSSEISEYEQNSDVMLDELIKMIGKEFQGDVSISTHGKSQK